MADLLHLAIQAECIFSDQNAFHFRNVHQMDARLSDARSNVVIADRALLVVLDVLFRQPLPWGVRRAFIRELVPVSQIPNATDAYVAMRTCVACLMRGALEAVQWGSGYDETPAMLRAMLMEVLNRLRGDVYPTVAERFQWAADDLYKADTSAECDAYVHINDSLDYILYRCRDAC
jgi:hypothetical protein